MENDNTGCLGIIAIVCDIAVVIFSGIAAWGWTEPDSFGTFLLFLLIWSALGGLLIFLLTFVWAFIAKLLGM